MHIKVRKLTSCKIERQNTLKMDFKFPLKFDLLEIMIFFPKPLRIPHL